MLENILLKNGFKLVEKDAIEDDGSLFSIFEYKGLPISYLYDDYLKEYYIVLRLDYLFEFKEWKKDISICDEFNGVAKVDIDKLISNCEYLIKKYNIKKENEEDIESVKK